jgi:Adenylylsulphate kinase
LGELLTNGRIKSLRPSFTKGTVRAVFDQGITMPELNTGHLECYLKSLSGQSVRVLRTKLLAESEKEDIKDYGYGTPVLIDYEFDRKQHHAVLHTISPGPFGHEHMADRAQILLWEHDSFNRLPREYFYGALAFIGRILTERGIPVIFDATANRRSYRDRAQQQIARFIEVFVDCPSEVCIRRDPKGIYCKAREGQANHVPGVQVAYDQ